MARRFWGGEARSLIRQRDEIERFADELLRESEDYKRLRRIPGNGPINALTILAEAGELRRFGLARALPPHCGARAHPTAAPVPTCDQWA